MDRVCKKKKKKTLHPFRTIFLMLIIAVCIYLGYEYKTNGNLNNVVQVFSQIDLSKIDFSKFDLSKINLSKIGFNKQSFSLNNSMDNQDLDEEKDGYISTYTTIRSKHKKTYKEYKQNLDSTWSNNSYWGGTMRENGCGITSMAIVASGYGLKTTPEDLRKKYYPHLEGEEMASALKKMGFKCTDFYYHNSYLNKKYISDWLKTNRPIIICVGSKKDNKWTNSSHYMVLLDVNSEGLVYLSNTNGLDGEENSSRMV